jgi:P27 family predicted phage terminase small subunit
VERLPKAPSGLSPEGLRYWKIANKNWILDDDALEVLRNACFSLSRAYQAAEIVNKEGLVYKCGETIRQHPAIQIEIQARKAFLNAVKQLGLDPEEEKRLPGRPPERSSYES